MYKILAFAKSHTNRMELKLNDTCDEYYSLKKDNWFKNNEAHKITHRRMNTAKYCTFCCSRNCKSFDTHTVSGKKSLKKSKVIMPYNEKNIVKAKYPSPHFLYIRNGETSLEE